MPFAEFYVENLQCNQLLPAQPLRLRDRPQLLCGVERLTKADRLSTIAAAVAQDLNNELTVILSSVTRTIETLEPEDPTRELLLELKAAAQRCAWKASNLLNCALRLGGKPVAASSESLIASIDKTAAAGSGEEG